MRIITFLVFAALPSLSFADCPPAPDIAAEEGQLFERIQAVPNEMAAQPLSNALWELWIAAPDEPAQEMLDAGMQARSYGDFQLAIAKFDDLVGYCPEYAEGYNQRAFVYFLSGRFERALVDLDAAIERSPRHVGALSGKALTLDRLDRPAEAQIVLREALALNPWIPERHMLDEPLGEDL